MAPGLYVGSWDTVQLSADELSGFGITHIVTVGGPDLLPSWLGSSDKFDTLVVVAIDETVILLTLSLHHY